MGKSLNLEMLACEHILSCLLDSMRAHFTNERVIEMVCTLFMMMSSNGESKPPKALGARHPENGK